MTVSLALLSAASTPMNSQQHAPANTWHMKRVVNRQNTSLNAMPNYGIPARPGSIVDAVAMLIPNDWTFQSHFPQGPGDCNFTHGRIFLAAVAPDQSAGLIILPGRVSIFSTDRSILQSIQSNNQQSPQQQHCEIEQPQPLATKIVAISQALDKNTEITGPMQPIPGLSSKLPAMLAQANRNLAQQGAHVEAEAGRIPVRDKQSKLPNEGFLSVMQVLRTDHLPNGATITTIDYPVQVATFAPQGKYASMEPLFNAMLDSIVVDPDFAAQSAQTSSNLLNMMAQHRRSLNRIASEVAADNANTTRRIAAIQQGVVDYSSQVHASVAANRSAAFERSTQQFALSMNDQAIYKDPSTGQRVQMSNQYSHAWASTTGNTNEYILTDSPSFNPNGQAGSAAWKQMQPEQ